MGPNTVVWDVTYACPLRCTHCYSESGRRPARQVGADDLPRIADAIIALRPANVILAGGEPLLVNGIFAIAERLKQAGCHVARLSYLSIGATIPSGLASRVGFAERELPTDAQVAALGGAELAGRLQELAPPSVRVSCHDNLNLRMSPAQIAANADYLVLVVEADGEVRAMPIYEGTAGNLLTEPGEVLWERAVARWSDPLVTEVLSAIRTTADWAAATRKLDYHFGAERERLRIDRRPAFGVGGR